MTKEEIKSKAESCDIRIQLDTPYNEMSDEELFLLHYRNMRVRERGIHPISESCAWQSGFMEGALFASEALRKGILPK